MKTIARRQFLCASAAAACAASGPALAQGLLPVHVGASVDDGLTPVLYALKAGVFARNGLDVTLTSAQNGAALAAAVVGGSVDIGKSALMPLINAHLRGVNFKFVAGGPLYLRGTLTDALVVVKESPIASLSDVAGKTVSVDTLQSLNQMVCEAAIDQHGGNSASCRFVEVGNAAALAALQTGRTDIASIASPVLHAVLASGNVRSFGNPYDALGDRYLIAAWFCTADFATRNPAVVRRFGAAVREASAYANGHHDETVPIVAAYTGMSADVLRATDRGVYSTELDARLIQPVIDAAFTYRFIASTFDARELIA